jgi:hypothetical protein
LIYFVHQFKPSFKEAALLDDPEMLAAVTAINQQIHRLAPVLNSPSITNGITVKSSDAAAPIAWMLKHQGDAAYLFAVNMRNRPARGSFSGGELSAGATAEVLGESREFKVDSGEFADDFKPYEVHIYRIAVKKLIH